jgi:hypothetical protein
MLFPVRIPELRIDKKGCNNRVKLSLEIRFNISTLRIIQKIKLKGYEINF